MTVRRLSTDFPWTIRRTISGLIQAVAHSYFLATNNSKRLKTVANFSKAAIRKALQFLAFQAISQRLIMAKMPLVRMRSPVRIRVAAPVKSLDFQGFFLFLKNLNPVPKSHLATIWLLERDFFVFMPLWRGDFPAHPLLSGRSPARREHICSSWWRSARGRVCLIPFLRPAGKQSVK